MDGGAFQGAEGWGEERRNKRRSALDGGNRRIYLQDKITSAHSYLSTGPQGDGDNKSGSGDGDRGWDDNREDGGASDLEEHIPQPSPTA